MITEPATPVPMRGFNPLTRSLGWMYWAEEAMLKPVERKEWGIALARMENGWHYFLNDQQRKRILLQVVDHQDVDLRNIVIFRRLLAMGFSMKHIDLALSRAIDVQDRDFVAEVCSKLADTKAPFYRFLNILPLDTLLRVQDVLRRQSLRLYWQDAATQVLQYVRLPWFQCGAETAVECLTVAMDCAAQGVGLAGEALWGLLTRQRLSPLFLQQVLRMMPGPATNILTAVHTAALRSALIARYLTTDHAALVKSMEATGLLDNAMVSLDALKEAGTVSVYPNLLTGAGHIYQESEEKSEIWNETVREN